MKKKRILSLLLVMLVLCLTPILFIGCSKADTIQHNISKDADNFKTYRKMTFVNLYTGQMLYSAEGYFSVQTSYDNTYQGQQEIALVFKVGADEYKMDYFSIAENVCYVIEQTKNTTTDPYHWKIVWYVPLPDSELA